MPGAETSSAGASGATAVPGAGAARPQFVIQRPAPGSIAVTEAPPGANLKFNFASTDAKISVQDVDVVSSFPCVMLGEMQVVEIDARFDGVIVELSQGGCAFRPASLYLLDRTDEVVTIRAPDFEAPGRIRAARPDSYGVQFFEDLDAALVARLVAAYGGRISDSFLARPQDAGMGPRARAPLA